MPSVQERQKGLAGNNNYMTGGVISKFKPRVLVQGSLYVFHFVKMLKGNMHHKYDVSSKVAFYTIDLAAGIFLLKNLICKQRGTFCLLTFPSHQPQFTISSGRWKTEPDEKEK